jgi:glycosyltransferase involved in cell wall biosynthesis
MNISVIIPVYNESGNIFKLSRELQEVFEQQSILWECIWVDDGSKDDTWKQIQALPKPNRGIKLRVNSGQTTATMAGIDSSKYDHLVTIDGDGQNDPKDITKMIQILESNTNLDLIQGFREKRNDHKIKKVIPSKIANYLVRTFSGHQVLDLGCSLRLFKKYLITNFRLTGEMHRLFTLYLLDNGAASLQVPVVHRPRTMGVTKYGLGRVPKLLTDILLYKALKAMFISPIYTFAKFALFGFGFGSFIFLLALLLRITNYKNYIDGNLVSTSVVIFAVSTIFIGLGLIAEMVTRVIFQNSKSYQYAIASTHN